MPERTDWSDFWEQLQDARIPNPLPRLLPATSDRFYEARFFVQLIADLIPQVEDIDQANWLVSAHFAATIGIYDAAKADFDRAGWSSRFNDSELGREFFLKSTAEDASQRDPLAMNRAFRDLRNLRTHFASPLAILSDRAMEPELAGLTSMGTHRWFLRPIVLNEHRRLRKPLLTKPEIYRFNDYVNVKPLVTVLSQHLYILFRTILQTAEDLIA